MRGWTPRDEHVLEHLVHASSRSRARCPSRSRRRGLAPGARCGAARAHDVAHAVARHRDRSPARGRRAPRRGPWWRGSPRGNAIVPQVARVAPLAVRSQSTSSRVARPEHDVVLARAEHREAAFRSCRHRGRPRGDAMREYIKSAIRPAARRRGFLERAQARGYGSRAVFRWDRSFSPRRFRASLVDAPRVEEGPDARRVHRRPGDPRSSPLVRRLRAARHPPAARPAPRVRRRSTSPSSAASSQIVSPHQRFSVKFYLVAMLFVVFDVEAVFFYPWGAALPRARLVRLRRDARSSSSCRSRRPRLRVDEGRARMVISAETRAAIDARDREVPAARAARCCPPCTSCRRSRAGSRPRPPASSPRSSRSSRSKCSRSSPSTTCSTTAPQGRHHVYVCTNLPCSLRGARDLSHALEQHLGVEAGETTPDGRITLGHEECLGACA